MYDYGKDIYKILTLDIKVKFFLNKNYLYISIRLTRNHAKRGFNNTQSILGA